MVERINKLKDMIKEGNVVFFGGAGVSVPSGIPDFRSNDGIFTTDVAQDPEYLLSSICFSRSPEDFYNYYKKTFDLRKFEPNIVHKKLAEWEEKGWVKGIITQNVDGLHEKAGSKNIVNYHGTIYKNRCCKCEKEYPVETIFDAEGIPMCACGAKIRPDIVLYGEMIPNKVCNKTMEMTQDVNTLIIAGTSLSVYPAANIVSDCNAKNLVIINKESLKIARGNDMYESWADLVFHEDIAEVFSAMDI